MIKLTPGEKIMILRTRQGFSRKELGHIVYIKNNLKDLEYPDGRLKKIETNIIQPKNYMPGELEIFAKELGVSIDVFETEVEVVEEKPRIYRKLCLNEKFMEMYPDLEKYFDLLNQTINIDPSLCQYNFQRMAEYVGRLADNNNKKPDSTHS